MHSLRCRRDSHRCADHPPNESSADDQACGSAKFNVPLLETVQLLTLGVL
jgi:hypothetical protein